MNQAKIDQSAMLDAKIEALLAGEEELIPSSGFLGSVMECVQEEAVAPPPIPFPWKRTLPGILAITGVFTWGAVKLFRQGLPTLSSPALPLPHLPATLDLPLEQAGWVALALGVTLLSYLLSRRLAGRGGLL
ncbi:MAG: hypothetical protein ACLQGT_06205 [Terracidiphilus sp.]